MKFTQEQYDILSKYEGNLYTATYASFVRFENRKAIEELDAIYKEHFGSSSSGLLSGCQRCVYNATKKLGTDYFKDKAVYKQLEEEAKLQETQVVTENKPKKATKKKVKDGTAE